MPRLEGRESTARKWPVSDLLIDSFHPHGAKWVPRAIRCCVKGCDHLVNEDCGGAAGVGRAVDVGTSDPRRDSGWICSHHVGEIMGYGGMLNEPPF